MQGAWVVAEPAQSSSYWLASSGLGMSSEMGTPVKSWARISSVQCRMWARSGQCWTIWRTWPAYLFYKRNKQDFSNRYAAIDKLSKFILVWFSWEIYFLITHKIKYFWFKDFWNKLKNIFLVESQVSLSSNFDIKTWEKPCEVCSAFTTALHLYCRQQVFTFKGKDASLVSTPLWFSQHPPSSS